MNLNAPYEQQIAWAAGLFEGERCITWVGDAFGLTLVNTDETVVRRFLDIMDLGGIYGPYENRQRDGYKRKPFWVWIARKYIAMEALDLLAPWLSARRLDKAYELTGLRFPVESRADLN